MVVVIAVAIIEAVEKMRMGITSVDCRKLCLDSSQTFKVELGKYTDTTTGNYCSFFFLKFQFVSMNEMILTKKKRNE